MDIKDLKNYKVPMNESMAEIPPAVFKKVERTALGILRKQIGILKLFRMLLIFKKTEKKFSTHNIDSARENGLSDEDFIKNIIRQASFFYALTEVVGKERAVELMYEITEQTAIDIMTEMMPAAAEFSTFDNPLSVAKEYILAMMAANKKVGIHESELVEDTDDAFQVNVTYCAFCEIPKSLGVMEAALSSCYADDVFFPKVMGEMGLRFVRKGTLARGDDVCDFRYEVIK